MNNNPLAERILQGEPVDPAEVKALSSPQRAALAAALLDESTGRRWLRGSPLLDAALAERLLEYEDDFRVARRDRTLARVIAIAADPAFERHVPAIAAGPAASALWSRLATDPDRLLTAASRVVGGDDARAAAAALYLLVLDPVSDYGLDVEAKTRIASAGLAAPHGEVRGLAGEHLAGAAPEVLVNDAERYAQDSDERLRTHAWQALFQQQPARAAELALQLLGDEAEELQVRRSALTAYGEHLPTSEVADLLAFFVVHPNEALAVDAAQLMFRLHRHPTIATPALESPHAEVRELALFLMDPYRGSPAAGGSRPGDPTTGDIFAEIARRIEEDDPDG